MVALIIILVLLAALIALLIVRTVKFVPQEQPPRKIEAVSFDRDRAVKNLQVLIRCKTVSYNDHSKEDNAEFDKLIGVLPRLYPNVCKTCPMAKLPDRAILFRWAGRAEGDPAVMMAHYDVVPVEPENWEKDPFEAIIEDGVLWGRGAIDTKISFNGVMSAAEHLITNGFVPERDIYFAFSGGEEVNGPGASYIVDWFEKKGIVPGIVVDEGGAVISDIFPGIKESCGVIGIAEKGMMNVTFSIESDGGHASSPAAHTPIGHLSKACKTLEDHPFPMHITKPVASMFDELGRRSTFLYRMIFSNLWLFSGVLDMLARKRGGTLPALLRTTVAFTQASGSSAPNVIPPSASFTANIRLNPEDSIQSAIADMQKKIRNPAIKLTSFDAMDPSPISELDCPAWEKVSSAVADTWNCVVTPYLMVQCSDSRHYGRISNHVYRFSAIDLTDEERATIHGNNERIRVEVVQRAVEFYIRLMQQC